MGTSKTKSGSKTKTTVKALPAKKGSKGDKNAAKVKGGLVVRER